MEAAQKKPMLRDQGSASQKRAWCAAPETSDSIDRPSLLFISPAIPARSGHGTSIRAGMLLRALSIYYRISLVVIPFYKKRQFHQDATFAQEYCHSINGIGDPKVSSGEPPYDFTFDIVYVFRLSMVSVTRRLFAAANRANTLKIVDIDDFESQTRARFAKLAASQGDRVRARREEATAQKFMRVERQVFSEFDVICVCSEIDRRQLQRQYSSKRVEVVPNCLDLPAKPIPPPDISSSFTILFVGTMDYYPNEDAVEWFCKEIMPLLRQKLEGFGLWIKIVGARPTRRVLLLRSILGVEVTGEVEDVEEHYANADLVIAPIRVGGGTRIKLLEAFALCRAVVCTTAACEGLAVEDGMHILIGDSPSAFAASCDHLLKRPDARSLQIAHACRWVQRHHSTAQMINSVKLLSR